MALGWKDSRLYGALVCSCLNLFNCVSSLLYLILKVMFSFSSIVFLIYGHEFYHELAIYGHEFYHELAIYGHEFYHELAKSRCSFKSFFLDVVS